MIGSVVYIVLVYYFVELSALEEELFMLVRLVRISDELQELVDTCAEPVCVDELY